MTLSPSAAKPFSLALSVLVTRSSASTSIDGGECDKRSIHGWTAPACGVLAPFACFALEDEIAFAGFGGGGNGPVPSFPADFCANAKRLAPRSNRIQSAPDAATAPVTSSTPSFGSCPNGFAAML